MCLNSFSHEKTHWKKQNWIVHFAGRLEKDDLNAKLGKLSNRIQEVKVEVFEALQKKYADFNPNPNLLSAQDLTNRVKMVSGEMEDMSIKIEKEVLKNINDCHNHSSCKNTLLWATCLPIHNELWSSLRVILQCFPDVKLAQDFAV